MPNADRKEYHIELTEYLDFTEAYAQIECVRDHVHPHKRLHSTLGNLRPAGFEHLLQLEPAKPES